MRSYGFVPPQPKVLFWGTLAELFEQMTNLKIQLPLSNGNTSDAIEMTNLGAVKMIPPPIGLPVNMPKVF